ncbi:MAG TPA: DMT family transporter [Marinagarivorans sp.]
MSIILAYFSVILIWATTPLAIHWSNTDFDFITAISSRIVVAALLGYALLKLMGMRLVHARRDWVNYAVGSMGLFPTMLLVYWAAKTVPSGIMSVIFGLFPFFVAVVSQLLFNQRLLTPVKVLALCIALVGLALINIEQLRLGWSGLMGVAAIVTATVCWALSSVWLKSLPAIPPFRQTVGSMVFATPLFVFIGWLFAEPLPADIGVRSFAGLSYLVVAGSLLGHTLFFYVLKHCAVTTVALIPLITPSLAMLLGWAVEGEVVGLVSLVGAMTVLTGLAIFQGVVPLLLRWLATSCRL